MVAVINASVELLAAKWAKQVCQELLSWAGRVYVVDGSWRGSSDKKKDVGVNAPSFGLALAHILSLHLCPHLCSSCMPQSH